MIAKGNLLAELAAAVAAGVAAAVLTLAVKILDSQPVPISTYLMYVLMAVASYSAVALALHRLWTGWLRRTAPTWVLTAFFGSVLFILIRLTPGVVSGWYDPLRSEPSLFNYVSTEVYAARSVLVVLSLATLPVAGLVYLLTHCIIRWREKRHWGSRRKIFGAP